MNPSLPEIPIARSVRCVYSHEPASELLAQPGVLAVISYAPTCAPGEDPRHYFCGFTQLEETPISEVWYSNSEVVSGTDNGCSWACTDDVLFAACWIQDDDPHGNHHYSLRVEQSYRKLLALIEARGYQQIVRMWNYLPQINAGDGDLEHYRQFCTGRHAAFTASEYCGEMYPSACALGHTAKGSIFYLLAAKTEVAHIENPNQVSAYHYPRRYGPASPSFARATLVDWGAERQLYVSGTASIVGHKSRFEGDLDGQLQTTFDNLDALLARSGEAADMDSAPSMSVLKVYVRDPQHYLPVQRAVSQQYPGVPAVYLRADICRSELLVEVDGMSLLPPAAAGVEHLPRAANE